MKYKLAFLLLSAFVFNPANGDCVYNCTYKFAGDLPNAGHDESLACKAAQTYLDCLKSCGIDPPVDTEEDNLKSQGFTCHLSGSDIQSDSSTRSSSATQSRSATQSGFATQSRSATQSGFATQSRSATQSGFATQSKSATQSRSATQSGSATQSNSGSQSGSGNHSGTVSSSLLTILGAMLLTAYRAFTQ